MARYAYIKLSCCNKAPIDKQNFDTFFYNMVKQEEISWQETTKDIGSVLNISYDKNITCNTW